MTRKQERSESARQLNSLSADFLFDRFGITRVGELTGLDTIGVPVWSSCRPLSHSVSANAGKSQDWALAKAGAIAEAIEISIFERPELTKTWSLCKYTKDHLIEFGFPLGTHAKDKVYQIAQEPVLHYASGAELLFPSDLVWLNQRENSPFLRSSNGQALGATIEDAVLHGLYECIERDAMTIRSLIEKENGTLPPFVDLSGAPDSIALLAWKIAKAGLRLFVARMTVDIPLPVYTAFLLDPSESHAPFHGYGTSIFDRVAVEAAILEAIQSRAVYIAGARDDITKTRYEAHKETRQRELIARFDLVQPKLVVDWSSYEIETQEELAWTINDIGPWAGSMFVKMVTNREFPAAKVMIPGLEPPIFPGYKPVRWEKLKRDGKIADLLRTQPVRL